VRDCYRHCGGHRDEKDTFPPFKEFKSKRENRSYFKRLLVGVGGVAQVVKCLPSKHEALTSNPEEAGCFASCIYD
jgi:hypothetical protein